MKSVIDYLTTFSKIFFLSVMAIFIPSAILEPALFYFIYDYNYFLTSFVGFIISLLFFIFHRNFKILYIFNCILFLYLLLICVARIFYFNVFEFISRWNYILYLDFSLVAKGCLLLIILLLLVYATSLIQKKIIANIDKRNYRISIVSSLVILYLLILVRPIYENKKYFRFQGSHNGFGHELKRDYTNYFSEFAFEKFPDGKSLGISHFYESNNDKEFLLILESWGKLNNDSLNSEYLDLFAEDLANKFPFVAKNYTITIDSTNFYGSSVGAEARELFNGKSDDAYLYFMHGKNINIETNLIQNKKNKEFFTVAGYSSSGKFGVNASNVFDFRRRLGFDRIFTSENLNLETNINTEMEGFGSVYDEVMIDSLLQYVTLRPKYFGYGFTTNTHFPFIYNEKNPYVQRVLEYESNQMLMASEINIASKNLLVRVSAIINHIFFILNEKHLSVDKIIVVGDHKYPGNHDFSPTTVPALIVELKRKR